MYTYSEDELKKMREDVLKWLARKDKKEVKKRTLVKKISQTPHFIKENIPERIPLKASLIQSETKSFQKADFVKAPITVKKKEKTSSLKKSNFFVRFNLSVFLSVTFLFIFLLANFYLFHWDGDVALFITKKIPLPAAVVNNRVFLYYDYIRYYQALRKNVQGKTEKGIIRKKAVNKLIENGWYILMANKYNVSIHDDEMYNILAQMIIDAGSEENFKNFIYVNYGWNVDEFMHYILYPYLIRQKLTEKFSREEFDKYILNGLESSKIYRFIQ